MEPAKFIFDDDFSGEDSGLTYSSKMQKMSADAFEEGRQQGHAEALETTEKNCEVIMENVATTLAAVIARHEEQVASMEKNTAGLVLAIIKKLAPAIVTDKPIREIENLVEECLRNNPLEPRMVIRLDEQMLPALRKKIDSIQALSNYSGQIVLISEPMANISDCKVEWIDGGADRDFEDLMLSIEKTVQAYIDAPVMEGETPLQPVPGENTEI